MTKKEQFADIFDVVRQVADMKKFPLVDSEIRPICQRLLQYHGAELFRVLRAIPGENYFPSVFEIELRTRGAMGLPPGDGPVTVEKVLKWEREAVVSGQSPASARRSAEFMLKTLRERRPRVSDEVEQAAIRAELAPLKVEPSTSDALSGLEDFGEDPLAALEDF